MRVFVSFRREVTGTAVAQRFKALLLASKAFDDVVLSPDDQAPQADYAAQAVAAIARCDAFVALIGPGWADVRDGQGRRVDNPLDPIRAEITAALDRIMPMVPVLLDGATLPDASAITHALQGLVLRESVALATASLEQDFPRLMEAIGPGFAGAGVAGGAREEKTGPFRPSSRSLLAEQAGPATRRPRFALFSRRRADSTSDDADPAPKPASVAVSSMPQESAPLAVAQGPAAAPPLAAASPPAASPIAELSAATPVYGPVPAGPPLAKVAPPNRPEPDMLEPSPTVGGLPRAAETNVVPFRTSKPAAKPTSDDPAGPVGPQPDSQAIIRPPGRTSAETSLPPQKALGWAWPTRLRPARGAGRDGQGGVSGQSQPEVQSSDDADEPFGTAFSPIPRSRAALVVLDLGVVALAVLAAWMVFAVLSPQVAALASLLAGAL